MNHSLIEAALPDNAGHIPMKQACISRRQSLSTVVINQGSDCFRYGGQADCSDCFRHSGTGRVRMDREVHVTICKEH